MNTGQHMEHDDGYEHEEYDIERDRQMHIAYDLINDTQASFDDVIESLLEKTPMHAKSRKSAIETLISMAQSDHAKNLAAEARVHYTILQQREASERLKKYVSDNR